MESHISELEQLPSTSATKTAANTNAPPAVSVLSITCAKKARLSLGLCAAAAAAKDANVKDGNRAPPPSSSYFSSSSPCSSVSSCNNGGANSATLYYSCLDETLRSWTRTTTPSKNGQEDEDKKNKMPPPCPFIAETSFFRPKPLTFGAIEVNIYFYYFYLSCVCPMPRLVVCLLCVDIDNDDWFYWGTLGTFNFNYYLVFFFIPWTFLTQKMLQQEDSYDGPIPIVLGLQVREISSHFLSGYKYIYLYV